MERKQWLDYFNDAYDRGRQDALELINKYCHTNAKTIPELIVMINQMKREVTHD